MCAPNGGESGRGGGRGLAPARAPEVEQGRLGGGDGRGAGAGARREAAVAGARDKARSEASGRGTCVRGWRPEHDRRREGGSRCGRPSACAAERGRGGGAALTVGL